MRTTPQCQKHKCQILKTLRAFTAVSKAQMSDPSWKSVDISENFAFLSQLFQLWLLHCLYRSEVGRKCNPCRSNQAISCVRATCTCTFLARVKNIRNVKNQTLLELPAPAPSLCGKHKKCQNQAISIANNSSLAFGLLDPCNSKSNHFQLLDFSLHILKPKWNFR